MPIGSHVLVLALVARRAVWHSRVQGRSHRSEGNHRTLDIAHIQASTARGCRTVAVLPSLVCTYCKDHNFTLHWRPQLTTPGRPYPLPRVRTFQRAASGSNAPADISMSSRQPSTSPRKAMVARVRPASPQRALFNSAIALKWCCLRRDSRQPRDCCLS